MALIGLIISGLALFGSFVAVVLLYIQLRQASGISKANLLFSVNRDLSSYQDIGALFQAEVGDDWVEHLNATTKERLLDYISYFEGIGLALSNGLLTVEEVDLFFSNRLFRVLDNPSVKKHILSNTLHYGDAFRPVYALLTILTKHRARVDQSRPSTPRPPAPEPLTTALPRE
jgi:hypothetical protein